MIYRGSVPVKVTRNDVLAIRYALRYSPGGRVCFAFLSALSPDGVRVVCGVFRLRSMRVCTVECGIVLKMLRCTFQVCYCTSLGGAPGTVPSVADGVTRLD